jgi:WD40 repeat protein
VRFAFGQPGTIVFTLVPHQDFAMAPRFSLALVGLCLAAVSAGAEDIGALPHAAPHSRLTQEDPLPAGARARLGSTRYRLPNAIGAAALAPNGKWIATSNNGDIITLADPATGKEVHRLRIPGGFGASLLTFSPDGQNIAVMGYMPFLQIVAVPSGKLVAKLPIPQPNNNRLSCVSFSGDGKIIAAGTDNFGQSKNFVHTWEVATGKPLHDFEVVQNSQIRACLSHDGSVLATAGFYSPRHAADTNPDQGRTIQLWNGHTGKELRKIKIERNQVMAVALSPDGKTCAAASGSATFHLFATDTGKELRRFAGRRGRAQFLQFAPDGTALAAGSADGTVQVWESKTGKRLAMTEGPRQQLAALAFPSPGQIWAFGVEGQALVLWDALTGQRLSPNDGHMTSVSMLAYAADGKTLLSGGTDGTICSWDNASASQLRRRLIRDEDGARFYGNAAARLGNYALSLDGKFLATANDYGTNTIRLFDMTSGKVVCDFDTSRANSVASGFAFSPDNSRLAVIGLNAVQIWDITTGQELPALPFKKMPANNVASNGGSLAFAPDGRTLAAAHSYYERTTGNPGGEVYLWNLASGSDIACLEGSGFFSGSLAFSTDSQVLAVPVQNQNILLIKASTGKELGRLEGSQAGSVQGLTFSPDGRLLAGAQHENYFHNRFSSSLPPSPPGNRIMVWELASGQIRQEFGGHQGAVTCLAFSPDGQTLASGSSDTTILQWDLSGKRPEPFEPLPPARLEAAWQSLAEKNGRHAFQELMSAMISSPEMTPRILGKHLQPAAAIQVDPAEVDRLIAELGSDQFAVRNKATKILARLGGAAGAALRQAQSSANSLEAQRRLRFLVERLDQPTLPADEIRLVRAVEVLEKIGSPQARSLLHNLAAGAPHQRLTVEAEAALSRRRRN